MLTKDIISKLSRQNSWTDEELDFLIDYYKTAVDATCHLPVQYTLFHSALTMELITWKYMKDARKR